MSASSATVLPGGISTVALLKAHIDEGGIYTDIFVPLICELAATALEHDAFLAKDMQQKIEEIHRIKMPLSTVERVLLRATKKGYLSRGDGAYSCKQPPKNLTAIAHQREHILRQQENLSVAFLDFAKARGVEIFADRALETLLDFLDERRLTFLLSHRSLEEAKTDAVSWADAANDDEDELKSSDINAENVAKPVTKERILAAMFVSASLRGSDEAIKNAILSIVDGLTIYRAAFLADLNDSTRQFHGMEIYFDSALVRKLLGLEGDVEKRAIQDAVSVLKKLGVRCNVFRPTIDEIRRILTAVMYSLGGIPSRSDAMTAHFIHSGYTAGDIAQLMGTLELSVTRQGLRICQMPPPNQRYMCDEAELERRLASPSDDVRSGRVQHDVQCVSAIMTLRKAVKAARVEDAKALFVSSSYSVITTVSEWYRDTEREAEGIPPMVPFDMLTNLAWLKRPELCEDLRREQLLAFCGATLRPGPQTWGAFHEQLAKMISSGEMDDEEAVSLSIHALSGYEFAEAMIRSGDRASTYKELIARVEDRKRAEFEPIISAERQRAHAERLRAGEAEAQRDAAIQKYLTAVANRRKSIDRFATRCSKAIFTALALLLAIAGVLLYMRGQDLRSSAPLFVAGVIVALVDGLGRNEYLRRPRAAFRRWLETALNAMFEKAEQTE